MLKSLTPNRYRYLEMFIRPWMVKRLFLKLPFNHIVKGSLTLTLFNETHRYQADQPGKHADLSIVHPLRAYWLIHSQGELGFAQAYYEGAIETHSLHQIMHFFYDNYDAFNRLLNEKTFNLWHRWQHRRRHNSLENSQKNISFHYDLGNDFYAKWLDSTMSYSSALFDKEHPTMEAAQTAKYQRMLDEVGAQANDSILEIGCGWGGLMEAALEKGCKIKGLTLSKEQQRFSLYRLGQHFGSERFNVALQDYRHETEQFDHVISIEMFEAVGKEYWPSYFETLQKTLKPGGKACLQIITIADEHAERYQSEVDFIQRYIFPGGILPSVQQLETLSTKYGFAMNNVLNFGDDYAKTCQYWKQNFNRNSDSLLAMGYDKAFQRLWNYYLDYCTVGFETKHISVHQITLTRKTDFNIPEKALS